VSGAFARFSGGGGGTTICAVSAPLTARNLRAGMTAEDARAAARRQFGNVTVLREEIHQMNGFRWLDSVGQDVRYALRGLRRSPGFTVVAVLTLALGIGATTSIFSVVYGVLLGPLPYRDASRLIVLNETTPRVGTVSVSYADFLDWRAQSRAFSQMSAVDSVGFNLAGITQPESISGDAVTPNFLSLLGVRPYLGRDFEPLEEKPGSPPVVLLSYALWQSHLGADPQVLGRTIMLDGRSFTIVGVLPPNFRALDKVDVLEPIGVWAGAHKDEVSNRGDRGDLVVMGRLALVSRWRKPARKWMASRRGWPAHTPAATTSSASRCSRFETCSLETSGPRSSCSSARWSSCS
jgi:putative ABC transport system permease protein